MATRIHIPSPSDRHYLAEAVNRLGLESGIPESPEIVKHFEIASQDVPDIFSGKPIDLNNPRIVFARATVSGRENFIATITNLFVEPNYRGLGHGRELMNLIDDFARSVGVFEVLGPTGTWECSKLYEHCGYTQRGEGRKVGKIDEANGFQHERRLYVKTFG